MKQISTEEASRTESHPLHLPQSRKMSSHDSVQLRFSELNRKRLNPSLPPFHPEDRLQEKFFMEMQEISWLESLREEVMSRAAAAPLDANAFVEWFEDLKHTGPGQNDPLFPWLATTATASQMRWFLSQEIAGEAGFDDLVALSQVRLPSRPKLEMARNYWDEMGRGTEKGMHGPLLKRVAVEFGVHEGGSVITPALELSNLMAGLAAHRMYAYHSIGALGVIELTAPGRAAKVYEGLKRLGSSSAGTQYYLLHSTLDVKHSQSWNAEVLIPLVLETPRVATAIAEGALMRLRAGQKCFEEYRAHFDLN